MVVDSIKPVIYAGVKSIKHSTLILSLKRGTNQ